MDDERTGTPQPIELPEERSHVGIWRVPPELRPDCARALVSILAWRLVETSFYALRMETLGRSFRERTACLLVTFETTGPFAPVLMEFVTEVEIDGVRYRRVRDECDLCSALTDKSYGAVMSVAIADGMFFPRQTSEDIELIFAVPEP
ncbi:MAG: hypothetical protein HY437_01840 [Candidatus Magasanikbacteria bacterium]|nr:hypothetical protein [Candidatus Magasanikbacteria bacterium]